MTDSRPRKGMKRSFRRLAKEDFLAHIPPSSDLASLFALGKSFEGPSTHNRRSSSSSIDDALYALRTVRRLLDTSETACPVPRKTIPSQHAANNPTPSPSKTSSSTATFSVRALRKQPYFKHLFSHYPFAVPTILET
ncbi:hypothetical protein BDR05DRAFT_1011600 [Suillus weaverae]|nr:hypothetical protein BDR05DRAFT_1011600 [Suillus weaverae]